MELYGWQRAKYINSVCNAIIICTTDANRPEKKDEVLKPMDIVWLSFL